MQITIENVTPKKAEDWLNANKSNRKLRPGVVEKYSSDMAGGAWTECPEPISFYEDGDIADGQHRLWAIVDSGKAQSFPVCRGLTRAAGLNINTGLNRSLVDNARISKADTGLSHDLIATSRGCAEGTATKGTYSNARRLAMVAEHREACEWAVANGPRGKYLRNATVLSAIARAWYHETDTDRLRRFSDVLTDGFMQGDEETAAVAIRNYLMLKGTVASSSAMWRDTFLKVQNAISYFMRGKKLTVIKGQSEETYPLRKTRRR